jgi:succinate-semialdehyde dehydrogenase/glutarate-semialdehyde dehydrogenase
VPADTITTINPATGEDISAYPVMSWAEVREVVAKVDRAQKSWAAAGFEEKSTVLRRAAAILRERSAELGSIATEEMGKPITEAVAEVEKCAWVCEYYAETSPTVLADREVQASGSRSWVSYEPMGTVLAIMPWNFPFWQVFRFAAPALMAGNGALLKHSPNVTGTALAIESILRDAGLPADLFRTLVIAEADVPATVERLIGDDRINAVTLTGSNRAGAHVAAAAGRAAKKSLLELGGSDPFVVLEDADLDVVVAKAVAGRFLNTGQSCLCAKRFIVHSTLVDQFSTRFAEAVASLPMGDPRRDDTKIGPMARADLATNLAGQVDRSVAAGARVLTGGRLLPDRGPAWFAPTVIVDVNVEMPVMAEETFGPVAAVIPFDTDDEAVELANHTPYGLGASVWSRDPERGLALGRRIESGALFVNANTASDPRLPFGGVKQSGYGRELGEAGATEFTNIRTVLVG